MLTRLIKRMKGPLAAILVLLLIFGGLTDMSVLFSHAEKESVGQLEAPA